MCNARGGGTRSALFRSLQSEFALRHYAYDAPLRYVEAA